MFQVVSAASSEVCFCSSHCVPAGQVLELERSGVRRRVRVEACRPLGDGQYFHRAAVEAGAFEPGALRHPLLRGPERFPCRVRVMSRHLPGFRGVTVDLHSAGLQLETEGPVPVGKVLQVTIEFDVCSFEPVACSARVAWCGQRGRRWVCGLELSAEASGRLKKFERYLAGDVPLHRLASRRPAVDAAWSRSLWGRLEAVEVSQVITARVGGVALVFSDPQMVRAETGGQVAELRELRSSPMLASVPGPFRHYQLVSGTGVVLAEVISRAFYVS